MRPYNPAKDSRKLTLAVLVVTCTSALSFGFLAGRYYAGHVGATLGGGTAVSASTLNGAESQALCTDTCGQARNGVCNDGRPVFTASSDWSRSRSVLCDLGTDCSDCGPWIPSGPVPWDTKSASSGPIAQLLEKQTVVRTRETITQPPFLFAYSDPQLDVDVSYQAENAGGIELHITKIYHDILSGRCARQDGGRELFVDVGSNFGWFALYAAKLGCRVIAFEPVPLFRHFLEYNVHLNGLAGLISVHSSLISHTSGVLTPMQVPGTGIWGTAGIAGLNIDLNIKSAVETLMLPTTKLDEVIMEDALLMKVDVEGWEWSVLAGAADLLKQHRVENIILEYSPGVFERHSRHDDIMASIQMLQDLIDSGYRIGHIGEEQRAFANTLDWDADLRPLQEVTSTNLQYDKRDAIAYKDGSLGCPVPPSMSQFRPWTFCRSIPEDFSPFSFRSIIGHNTNIWASKNSTLLPLQGQVGILDLASPPQQYFVADNSKYGMGHRLCSDMPDEVAVRHRCRCKDSAACAEEYAAVEALVHAGKLASNFRIDA